MDLAKRFADLHVKGDPLLLYNAWDAGSAKATLAGGAKVIATSSWAVAAAQGYEDGETLPLDLLLQVASRIVRTVDVPVTVDFEGGYSEDESHLAENITRLLELGVVGINFEDRVVKGKGLYPIDKQAGRIAAIRAAADKKSVKLFINARTDLFLGQGRDPATTVGEAVDRAKAYAAAGASGFFIPGLTEDKLIGRIAGDIFLPVNVMVMKGVPSNHDLANLGVARISYAGAPYGQAMSALQASAKSILKQDR